MLECIVDKEDENTVKAILTVVLNWQRYRLLNVNCWPTDPNIKAGGVVMGAARSLHNLEIFFGTLNSVVFIFLLTTNKNKGEGGEGAKLRMNTINR